MTHASSAQPGTVVPAPPLRDYAPVIAAATPLGRALADGSLRRDHVLQRVSDLLWDAFSGTFRGSVSWIGFYVFDAARPSEMTLVARRNKPACSPIGLHGACGQCLRACRPLVVRDVKNLGAGYVACDPRDQAEVVLPLIGGPAAPAGPASAGTARAWGVLDGDSFDTDAFGTADALGMNRVLIAAGLTTARFESAGDCVVR